MWNKTKDEVSWPGKTERHCTRFDLSTPVLRHRSICETSWRFRRLHRFTTSPSIHVWRVWYLWYWLVLDMFQDPSRCVAACMMMAHTLPAQCTWQFALHCSMQVLAHHRVVTCLSLLVPDRWQHVLRFFMFVVVGGHGVLSGRRSVGSSSRWWTVWLLHRDCCTGRYR